MEKLTIDELIADATERAIDASDYLHKLLAKKALDTLGVERVTDEDIA